MVNHEEDDLNMALRLSTQHSMAPEAKRSKPLDLSGTSTENFSHKSQRELMAEAAERRMFLNSINKLNKTHKTSNNDVSYSSMDGEGSGTLHERVHECAGLVKEISSKEANNLFGMMFGRDVSKGILAQWSNQGIKFSPDPETSVGLVQHEGGPCGVLAAVQALVLKYLIFIPEKLGESVPNIPVISSSGKLSKSQYGISNNFASLTEDVKSRALTKSMAEILFLCGNNKKATIATFSIFGFKDEGSEDSSNDEIITKSLEGISIESGSDIQKNLIVNTFSSLEQALQSLEAMIPIFQSRMGAMLFLISALLSRGLDNVQADRDDTSLPLVTSPFGHASQEIVNLLLCGQAVPNVFDGSMDFGGGMFLKGISTNVEVGFLSFLESLNLCKVGNRLKCPKWPIWVVGSESHYTVLFALDPTVQAENELEEREAQIRKAFDRQDQSGGGGFISVEGFRQVLKETSIELPAEKLNELRGTGFIVWSEFWQVVLDLDKRLGGVRDSSGLMGKRVFDLYHFNGIAKSVSSGGQMAPRLTKVHVLVPPKWTREDYMADSSDDKSSVIEAMKSEPAQHAPLVDCIRTRWSRAVCSWDGDLPSIV